MLTFDPDKRIKFEQILQHSFLDYYSQLGKSGSPGYQFPYNGLDENERHIEYPDLNKLLDQIELQKAQSEIRSNYQLKTERLK